MDPSISGGGRGQKTRAAINLISTTSGQKKSGTEESYRSLLDWMIRNRASAFVPLFFGVNIQFRR